MSEKRGRTFEINEVPIAEDIPTLHIIADTIPGALYYALRALWDQGVDVRTQYDQKNAEGEYQDPKSKDAEVGIKILRPFSQPRFSAISFEERGKYLAEIMGAKDHLAIPYDDVLDMIKRGEKPKRWSYTYSQRLRNYLTNDGKTINQLELMLDTLAEAPFSRRAVATTIIPYIDNFIDDPPCFELMQLRCTRDNEGGILHMFTRWRSRDALKAWDTNLMGFTFLNQILAQGLKERTGIPFRAGSYSEVSTSLHIYGSYFDEMKMFFERNPDIGTFLGKCYDSTDPDLVGLTCDEIEAVAKGGESYYKKPFPLGVPEMLINLSRDIRSGKLAA